MIASDFSYYKPESVGEAVGIYSELEKNNKTPLYFSGGTEIITLARAGSIKPGAVIDIKDIPECKFFGFDSGKLVIGSGVTLSNISEANFYSLLTLISSRIADHTAQCKITIGGNVASTIIYRETTLALFLTDAEVKIACPGGLKTVPFNACFNERLNLQKGEFVVQFIIDKKYLNLPFVHAKKTKNEKIDYPLLTVAAIKADDKIRAAFSGLVSYPFRSPEIENVLNDKTKDAETRSYEIIKLIPPPLNDVSGTSNYRKFVLKETVSNTIKVLEEYQGG